MKDIKTKKEAWIQSCDARIPNGFEWKLLDTMLTDLGFRSQPGDENFDHGLADVDLTNLIAAIRGRSVPKLMEAIAELGPQRIVPKYGNQERVFFLVYQISAFLKKFPFNGDKAKANALDTFLKYERLCRQFNTENIKTLVKLNRSHPRYLGIIEEIRADICRLIGEAPNVQRIYDCAKHGPGTAAGFEKMAGMVTPYFKWSNLPYTLSSSVIPYAKTAILQNPQWVGALMNAFRDHFRIPQYAPINMAMFWGWCLKRVDYCRYSSVPKNAETERSIAIEPTLNVFFQLGVDRVIRSRLKKRWKIDLNTQELNQKLAFESSISGENATIDLRGASEMVTRALCLVFLPAQWYSLLDDLRSKEIRLPEGLGTVPLAKMSAMGNGFTFALESLIFAAIARTAMRREKVKGNLAVFGDDLVVPTSVAPFLIDLLKLSGFLINEDKSFVSGPFRESCGVDCLNGYNVRPFFLKKPVTTIQDIFLIHNSLTEMEEDLPWQWCVSFANCKALLRRYIPKKFGDVYGPRGESKDSYLFSDRRLAKNSLGETWQLVITTVPVEFSKRGSNFFFRKLMNSYGGMKRDWLGFGTSSGGSAYDITMRDCVRYKLAQRRVWGHPIRSNRKSLVSRGAS